MNRILHSSLILGSLSLLFVASPAFAGVYVRYHNGDDADYKWQAVCHGSTYTVEFGSRRTSDATIQGDSPCVLKTPKGEVTLKGGERIDIKDAKVTIE